MAKFLPAFGEELMVSRAHESYSKPGGVRPIARGRIDHTSHRTCAVKVDFLGNAFDFDWPERLVGNYRGRARKPTHSESNPSAQSPRSNLTHPAQFLSNALTPFPTSLLRAHVARTDNSKRIFPANH